MTAPEKKSVSEITMECLAVVGMKFSDPGVLSAVEMRIAQALAAERRDAEEAKEQTERFRSDVERFALKFAAAEARERKLMAVVEAAWKTEYDYYQHELSLFLPHNFKEQVYGYAEGVMRRLKTALDQDEGEADSQYHSHPIYADQSYVNCPACDREKGEK